MRAHDELAAEDFAAQWVFDTHVWIWYVEGDERRISPRVRTLVESDSTPSRILVSAISIWEVAMLEARQRIRLSSDLGAWVTRALYSPFVRLKPVSPMVAIESTRLPGQTHGDPADRILIATARLLGAALVTCDERILRYGQQGHVRVLDARPT